MTSIEEIFENKKRKYQELESQRLQIDLAMEKEMAAMQLLRNMLLEHQEHQRVMPVEMFPSTQEESQPVKKGKEKPAEIAPAVKEQPKQIVEVIKEVIKEVQTKAGRNYFLKGKVYKQIMENYNKLTPEQWQTMTEKRKRILTDIKNGNFTEEVIEFMDTTRETELKLKNES